MNRADFQRLAEERVRDAEALLAAGRWSGAYSLAGYAVECALKACIAKLTREYDFPDKDTVNKSYTHSIKELVKIAGLEVQLKTDLGFRLTLALNFTSVYKRDEKSRYIIWSESEAQKLYRAVLSQPDGVLPWLKLRW